jgi:hypothetical protein
MEFIVDTLEAFFRSFASALGLRLWQVVAGVITVAIIFILVIAISS